MRMKYFFSTSLFVAAGLVSLPTSAFAIEPAWVGVRAGTGGLGVL
jgi:hypothetical protein